VIQAMLLERLQVAELHAAHIAREEPGKSTNLEVLLLFLSFSLTCRPASERDWHFRGPASSSATSSACSSCIFKIFIIKNSCLN
jgi:hypothetical protein